MSHDETATVLGHTWTTSGQVVATIEAVQELLGDEACGTLREV